MLFSIDYKIAYKIFISIGSNYQLNDLIKINYHKIFVCNNHTNYKWAILGSLKCGKTSLLENLIGNKFQLNVASTNI